MCALTSWWWEARDPFDEERGLMTIEEHRDEEYTRECEAQQRIRDEASRIRQESGFYDRERVTAIMDEEVKALERNQWDTYRLKNCLRRALDKEWPKELTLQASVNTGWESLYKRLPGLNVEEHYELLRLIIHRGVRTHNFPKAIRDVLRSRRIRTTEAQSRVVTRLAK